MSVVEDLYEALSVFAVPVRVHPAFNILDGDHVNALNEAVSFTRQDLDNDSKVERLNDPVVPKSSEFSAEMAQLMSGGGDTLPTMYKWYSEHEYRCGTLVETKGHVLQIDKIADYDNVAGIFVYLLKGDDALVSV